MPANYTNTTIGSFSGYLSNACALTLCMRLIGCDLKDVCSVIYVFNLTVHACELYKCNYERSAYLIKVSLVLPTISALKLVVQL